MTATLRGPTLCRLLFIVGVLLGPVVAAEPSVPIRITGKLEKIKGAAKSADARHQVVVGPRTYHVLAGEEAAKALDALAGKPVQIDGTLKGKLAATSSVMVDDAKGVAALPAVELKGFVRAIPGEKKKRTQLALEMGKVKLTVVPKLARKLAKFQDLHVALSGRVAGDSSYAEIFEIESVKRELLPDERNPRNGDEALAGKWRGDLVATQVPRGVPGVKDGDEFGLDFATKSGTTKAAGSLMSTYEVVDVRGGKLSRKRTMQVSLRYSTGDGSSYVLKLDGSFSADWKKFEGTWSSGFLGRGTFALKWVGEAPPTL